MKVTVAIPVYNEQDLILEILRRVLAAPLPSSWTREVVIVDDGSNDGTTTLLGSAPPNPDVKVFSSIINHGKGAALRTAFKLATGDVILIQDGDLEYDPIENYSKLLTPFEDPSVEVVFGSRFLEQTIPEGMEAPNWVANRILTTTTNMLFGSHITDEATGYKVFRRSVLDRIGTLEATRFEFCPEFTAKVLRSGIEIKEVPISYRGRNRLQGKKIRAKDGLDAVLCLAKYKFRS